MKEYPETHQQGVISMEHIPREISSFILGQGGGSYFKGDFGIQIARDGRIWVCINGIAFIRFSPHPNGRMAKAKKTTEENKELPPVIGTTFEGQPLIKRPNR